jgi:hypothetical protein
MSSFELSCSRARVVCSRGYKLVGRGYRAQVPGVCVFGSSALVTVAPLSFIDARGKGKKGSKIRVTVLGHWDVLSCVVVRQGTLKRSRAMLSSMPPRGREGLFTLGRLALPPSSLELTQPARVWGELATLRPNRRPVLIIGVLEYLGRSWRATGSDVTAC